jgi:hypothetical protein
MLMVKTTDGKAEITPDFADEIIDAAALTHGGSRRTPEGKK